MSKIKNVFDNLEEILGTVLFVIMCFSVTLGIVARLFQFQVTWTNDIARYSFIWLVFLGASAGFKRKKHIIIEVFFDRFPEKLRKIFTLITNLLAIAFFVFIIIYGFMLAENFWSTEMATLPLSIGWVYLSLPVSAILMIIRIIQGMLPKSLGKE